MLKCLHVILCCLNSLHPTETTTHDFFGNAAFKFLHEPPNTKCKEKHCRNEGKRYCDACGKALKGFVYHCAARDLDLHPCCRNLETKMDIYGEEFRLQDKVSRLCNWWKKRGGLRAEAQMSKVGLTHEATNTTIFMWAVCRRWCWRLGKMRVVVAVMMIRV